jgi:hypothetical protein
MLRVMFLVVVLALSSSAAIISLVSVESFASKGTFNYTVSMAPTIDNRSGSFFICFYYEDTHQIVESKFAGLSDMLKVFPAEGSTQDNVAVEISYIWVRSFQFSDIFDASSPGIDLPHQSGLDRDSVVNVSDLISRDKIINDTLNIDWEASFDSIVATFSQEPWYTSPLRPAIMSSGQYSPRWLVFVHVLNGMPVEVTSGNETISSPFPSDYSFRPNEWSFNGSVDVPNVTILQAKNDLPTLLIITAVLTAAIPIVFYSKPSTKPEIEDS